MTIRCDLFARFPELNTNAINAVIDGVLSSWDSYIGLSYNEKNKEAVLNCIAHLATLESSPSKASSFTLNSVSVGSVSKSYAVGANVSANRSFWLSTKYGQRFFMLTANRIGPRFA